MLMFHFESLKLRDKFEINEGISKVIELLKLPKLDPNRFIL
jgi:hypothetical protein